MNHQWWILFGCVFTGSLAASLLLTPVMRKIACKLDFMDKPCGEAHKLHSKATPLLGGMAIYLSAVICAAAGLVLLFSGSLDTIVPDAGEVLTGIRNVSGRFLWLFAAASGAMLLGLADDRFTLKASRKFAGQFVIALMAVYLAEFRFTLFIDIPHLSGILSVFWFLLVMNSVNFFDNMDGLATGTAVIAFVFFTLTAAWQGQYLVAALSALAAGSAAGFWVYNYNPASIFLGDSGSHLLGFMMAALAVSVTYYTPESIGTPLAVLMPLFIMATPLFDTAAVVLIRTRNRKPFWIGDHNHISHRFEKMGMSKKRAVACVHLLAVIIALSVWPLLWAEKETGWILLTQAMLILLLVSVLQRQKQN